MEKQELLQAALDIIKEYDYISEDGILDLCDEDMELVDYIHEQLSEMVENGELTNEQYDC
ncbi:hypothetical protein UFOVP331_132 [uncultured Caudovirales phage]|uniref:Uncharacterized protein n=1 Tax=uncultured Caudovirales phage TaxID=2100421 RepID=A0A6J5LXF0_9CAUD|nr:hypothetical protein UFOVP331_132 [uncultured Caudovirales phage]